MVASVEKLYANYEVLSKNKGSEAELQTAFKEILAAVKGDTKVKQLACQFIVRFYKKFPALESEAIDAQLDLCEDDDQSIRRYAIKELPNFCKDNPNNVSKIADILGQLLTTDDNVELVVVQGSLFQLLKANPKECLMGVFQQLANPSDSDDSSVREKTCKFVSTKLATLTEKELSAETEKYIVTTVKGLMAKADACTFAGLLGILSVLKSMKLLTVRQQLIEVIETKAGINSDAKAFEANKAIMSFYMCCEQGVPFFSKNVSSQKFAICMCEKVLPAAMKKYAQSDDTPKGLPSKSHMLKLLAELSTHSGTDQVSLVTIQYLFQVLLDLMPTPPETLGSGDDAFSDFSKVDLCAVECAIYSFHLLSASHKEFFTDPEAQARMADFRKRLQYFALGVQAQTKKLNEALKLKLDPDSDELAAKKEMLLACSNISAIIKDLFRIPPHHTAQVTLSFKTAQPATLAEPEAKQAQKRHTPITGPAGGKDVGASNGVNAAKLPRQLYGQGRGGRGGRGGGFGQQRGRGFFRGNRY